MSTAPGSLFCGARHLFRREIEWFIPAICKSCALPSSLFVCSGAQRASVAAILVLISSSSIDLAAIAQQKELHGKAIENRARQGKTRRFTSGHGRGQYHLHGRSGARSKGQGSTDWFAHTDGHGPAGQAHGGPLSVDQEVGAAGRFEGPVFRWLGYF